MGLIYATASVLSAAFVIYLLHRFCASVESEGTSGPGIP